MFHVTLKIHRKDPESQVKLYSLFTKSLIVMEHLNQVLNRHVTSYSILSPLGGLCLTTQIHSYVKSSTFPGNSN